jgi:gliding motility-associated-like protein
VNNELSFVDETSVTVTNWNWDFGDSDDAGSSSSLQNPTHTYSDTGSYIVKLTITSNGSTYTDQKTIQISALPKASFSADSTQIQFSSYSRVFIDHSESFHPISHYIWNFGDNSSPISTENTSTLYKYTENGTYNVWLKVVDNEGCVDSVSKIVQIYDRFFVPNVFTPNNDQINDNFIITSNGITLFSIEIYSRWGNLVFKRSGHEQIIWDGRMSDGSLVSSGTYFYVINAESGDITYDPEKGFITVFY